MRYLIKKVCLVLTFMPIAGFSQNTEDVVQDLLVIADGFASPAANGIAYEANGGWFSSAQSLDPWKVEVSVHLNVLLVPQSRKSFSVSNNDFSAISIQGVNSANLPTAFGGDSDVTFEGSVFGNDFDFEAIDGIDHGFVGHPFAQVTVGLPAETELALRGMPKISVSDVNVSTYGIGLKHNISQYFKSNGLEDFQLAAFAAYSKFNIQYDFDPLDLEDVVTLNAIEVDANVWVGEILGSRRYNNFEAFGALGLVSSDFMYVMQGSGIALGLLNNALSGLNDSEAQFKGDIGFNVYLKDFKISTMATAGRFFNLNLGVHFRI